MGQTHKIEVVDVAGDTLTAKLSLVSVDEVYMWISPAYFACELQESTFGHDVGAKTGEALKEAGFHSAQDAEDDDDQLDALNDKAARFISSVQVGEVQDGRLVGKNAGALRVERIERKVDPWVKVTIKVTDPAYLLHLKKGAYWETAPIGFGSFPEKD